MATLPQLIDKDMQRLDEALREFIDQTDATAALIIDKGGFLITHQGDSSQFDVTTIGALASGAFMANQTIAGLVNETNFNSVYQQGEKSSMLVVNIDEHCLLIVIFSAASASASCGISPPALSGKSPRKWPSRRIAIPVAARPFRPQHCRQREPVQEERMSRGVTRAVQRDEPVAASLFFPPKNEVFPRAA